MIDVIVPVYKGLRETRRCLESVLHNIAAADKGVYRLIVVDDASPDPELRQFLRDLRERHAFTLIENTKNMGFVSSVNSSMDLSESNDVILVNSDTEIPVNGLNRLRAHAALDPKVGTITPFSNNATLCSYPHFFASHPIPSLESLSSLDDFFNHNKASGQVEIPTGVGFCMWIRRECLTEVGLFDEASFGKGYGEENDFCMRATGRGWKHVLAYDLFVFHEGGLSFGAEQNERKSRAEVILAAKHPRYATLIQAHREEDPARPFRHAVDLNRLVRETRKKVLILTHNEGGGVDKHIRDLAQSLSRNALFLVLRPLKKGFVFLEILSPDYGLKLYFSLPDHEEILLDWLLKIGVARVHFHHLMGFSPSVRNWPARLSCPYDFTVHDYFSVCPQVNLITEEGRYCREPNEEACNRCISIRPYHTKNTIQEWRSNYHAFLRGAERVLCPSLDVQERIGRYYSDLQLRFVPHLDEGGALPSRREKPQQILFLGSIDKKKGAELIQDLVLKAAKDFPDMKFVHIGNFWPESLEPQSSNFRRIPLDESSIEATIGGLGPSVFYFPAQCPETYSYVLNLALRAGASIVASRLGAFEGRLARYKNASLVAHDAPAKTWLSILQAKLAETPREEDNESFAREKLMAWDFYSREYLDGVGASPIGTKLRFTAVETHPFAYFPAALRGTSILERGLNHLRDWSIKNGISRWVPKHIKSQARRWIYQR